MNQTRRNIIATLAATSVAGLSRLASASSAAQVTRSDLWSSDLVPVPPGMADTIPSHTIDSRLLTHKKICRDLQLFVWESGKLVLKADVYAFNAAEGWYEQYAFDGVAPNGVRKVKRTLSPRASGRRWELVRERYHSGFDIIDKKTGKVVYISAWTGQAKKVDTISPDIAMLI